MDDIPLQKVQISGPTLASLLHRVSTAPADIDGLLFGRVTHITPSNLSDDDPTTTSSSFVTDGPTLIATVTSFFASTSTATFYSPSGHLNLTSLRQLLSSSGDRTLIGWFSSRRKTPLRPSLRESSVTASLSSKIHLSFPIQSSPKSYTFSPCLFLLLTTPFRDQLIHTHEYRAYQFRLSSDSFEPKTLDVVNIGPAFRGHYGNFAPNSPFPLLPFQPKILDNSTNNSWDSMVVENEKLETLKRESKDQKELDLLCAEDFEIGRLGKLMGNQAAHYTSELEELYHSMLKKLDGLSRQVEKSSAQVLDQENQNMKLRYKVAGLE